MSVVSQEESQIVRPFESSCHAARPGSEEAQLFDAANPTGYAQAVEEFEVVAAAPSSWVRTRSTVVGLDVLSTSTPRFAYPQSQGEPVPQPDAPLVLVYDAGGSVRDVLANPEAAGDFFTFAADADGATGGPPGASNPVLPQRADYDAFGELILFAPAGQSTPSVRRSQRDAAITDLEEALLSHLTYRGEQYDPHLRMQYLRARHYDQGTGRFTRVDPFAGVPGEPLTLHKYGYASSDPVNGMDPTGMFTLPEISRNLATMVNTISRAYRPVAKVMRMARAAQSVIQILQRFEQVVSIFGQASAAGPGGFYSGLAAGMKREWGVQPSGLSLLSGLFTQTNAYLRHRVRDVLDRSVRNAPLMAARAVFYVSQDAFEMAVAAKRNKDVPLIIDLPSEPALPGVQVRRRTIRLPMISVGRHEIVIQSSKDKGRLFALGWAGLAKNGDLHEHNVLRVDYQNFAPSGVNGVPANIRPMDYWPHYHVGSKNPKHYAMP